MNGIGRMLFGVGCRLVPETRGFALKRALLRLAGAKVGRNVRICSSARILGAGELEIGDNAWIGHECMISVSSKIVIGADCDFAPRVFVGTGTHRVTPDGSRIGGITASEDVTIGRGCWLCAGAMVLPGVKVGDMSVVAAGGVVNRDVEPFTMVGGVPAREIKRLK